MKNIHLIPTSSPSKIFYIAENFHLEKGQLIEPKSYHNVYITSDEEIKEGDWVLSGNKIYQIKESAKDFLNHVQGISSKIILTTDQDLIKDGVQDIDDTFLEWFVKNPSCEEVKVERTVNDYWKKLQLHYEFKYEIIISQEEPKQETLKEAAKKHINSENKYNRILCGHSFVEGAKWQQERMYSEEDLKYAFFSGCQSERQFKPRIKCWEDWFEQFKKK
jgi:hypothetical protein